MNPVDLESIPYLVIALQQRPRPAESSSLNEHGQGIYAPSLGSRFREPFGQVIEPFGCLAASQNCDLLAALFAYL
jgi:hypothetical protein